MMEALKIDRIQSQTVLYTEKLSSITYTVDHSTGTGKLSNKAQRLLWFFLACLRLGYTELRVPIGALRTAVARNAQYSERTLYRALRELENNAVIWRRQFRLDYDNRLSIISINRAAFTYWLERNKNVSPCRTSAHTHTQLPIRQNDDLTKIRCSNSKSTYIKSRPRAGARASQGSSIKKRPDLPAMLFTLAAILTPRRFWPSKDSESFANGNFLFEVAKSEYERPGSTDCPVDFAFWRKRWGDMNIDRREITARTEIIPYLKNCRIVVKKQKRKNLEKKSKKSVKTVMLSDRSPRICSASEISYFVSQLNFGLRSDFPPQGRPEATLSLSEQDLEILRTANAKAKRKVDST
jgi:hypothetical protein